MSRTPTPFLFAILVFGVQACGQDARNYDVTVPPLVSIEALDGMQSQTHSMDPRFVQFVDSDWALNSNVTAGATVTFAALAFQNQSDSASQRGVQLRLQNLVSTGTADWRYTDRGDRSRYGNGDPAALVSLASSSPGSATVRVRVRFLTGGNPTTRLTAGTYVTTVVGTISAN